MTVAFPHCPDGGECFARDARGFCMVLKESYEDEDRSCPFRKNDAAEKPVRKSKKKEAKEDGLITWKERRKHGNRNV